MFDEFREMADESSIFEDEDNDLFETYSVEAGKPGTRFLGMTAGQRFFLSIMFFMIVLIIGLMALLVTGKIWI
ncbi:MAG: hypothetical protein JXA25_19780 [Anaerolineales bacterium]|nr:hypothetical protein [Anaerolineales bacterium]